jgi:hypothetical protein
MLRYRLPWRSSFPTVGRAVYPTIPEVSFICLLNELQLASLVGMLIRKGTLRRIIEGLPDAVRVVRPVIWPAEYGDDHSGIRRLKSRWEAAWA